MTSWLFPNAECFRTLYVDPPWQYANFGQAKHGAARAHYPTMSLELGPWGVRPCEPFVSSSLAVEEEAL